MPFSLSPLDILSKAPVSILLPLGKWNEMKELVYLKPTFVGLSNFHPILNTNGNLNALPVLARLLPTTFFPLW